MLPHSSIPNLWKRLKWNYKDGKFYNYTVTDRIHKYNIYSTDFDNEIFSNYNLCSDDTLSYNRLYLVLDLVNEYSLNKN